MKNISNVNSTKNNNNLTQISYNFPNDNISLKSEKILKDNVINETNIMYPDNFSEANVYSYQKSNNINSELNVLNNNICHWSPQFNGNNQNTVELTKTVD